MDILQHPLAWRWGQLPVDVLAQMEALSADDALIWHIQSLLFLDPDCLSPKFFEVVRFQNEGLACAEVGAWLRAQQPDLERRIQISWSEDLAVCTTWGIFTAYWDDFCYPSSDDVVIFPEAAEWVLLYHHTHEFQFGLRQKV